MLEHMIFVIAWFLLQGKKEFKFYLDCFEKFWK